MVEERHNPSMITRKSQQRAYVPMAQENDFSCSSPTQKEKSFATTLRNNRYATRSPNAGKSGSGSRSHPWRVDLRLQKGGGSRSRGMRSSRDSWKSMMQQRKDVFKSDAIVLVEDVDEDKSEQSSQNQDDLCSLNSNLGSNRNEEPTETLTEITEEENGDEDVLVPGAAEERAATIKEVGKARDISPEEKLKADLKERTSRIYTGNHHCVEAVGRGESTVGRRTQQDLYFDARKDFLDDLKGTLSGVYTGHHDCVEASGGDDSNDEQEEEHSSLLNGCSTVKESLGEHVSGERQKHSHESPSSSALGYSFESPINIDAFPSDPRIKAPADTEVTQALVSCASASSDEVVMNGEQYSTHKKNKDFTLDESARIGKPPSGRETTTAIKKSLDAFEALMKAKRDSIGQNDGKQDDSDCCTVYSEYTVEESVWNGQQRGTMESFDTSNSRFFSNTDFHNNPNNSRDDSTCYTEYTVDDTTTNDQSTTSQSSFMAKFSNLWRGAKPTGGANEDEAPKERATKNGEDDDCYSCYTEYTIDETVAGSPAISQPSSTISAVRPLVPAENLEKSLNERAAVDGVDDDCYSCYTEYTIDETVAESPAKVPPGISAVRPLTSASDLAKALKDNLASVERENRGNLTDDDDEFEEYTVAETCVLQRDDSLTASGYGDDDDFEEYTVAETVEQASSFTISFDKRSHTESFNKRSHTETETTEGDSSNDDSVGDVSMEAPATPSLPQAPSFSVLGATRVTELLRQDIWSRDTKVVQSALGDLTREANQGKKYRSNIIRFGGVLAIVRAMDLNLSCADTQIAACGALESLAIDAENQTAIGVVGGFQTIIGAMKAHAKDRRVQQAACSALANLTAVAGQGVAMSSSPTDGLVETLVKTMQQNTSDPEIQETSFRSLANLCVDNQEMLKELSQVGGLAAMTMALQSPWKNATEKNEAISTLSILLRGLTLQD